MSLNSKETFCFDTFSGLLPSRSARAMGRGNASIMAKYAAALGMQSISVARSILRDFVPGPGIYYKYRSVSNSVRTQQKGFLSKIVFDVLHVSPNCEHDCFGGWPISRWQKIQFERTTCEFSEGFNYRKNKRQRGASWYICDVPVPTVPSSPRSLPRSHQSPTRGGNRRDQLKCKSWFV